MRASTPRRATSRATRTAISPRWTACPTAKIQAKGTCAAGASCIRGSGSRLRGWIENVDEKSVEEFDINGLPAATAVAKGDQWAFRLYAIRFGGDVYRFIFAAKQMSSEADRAFRYSVGTFRRMTQSEIDSARPLR